ncbi:hypothetical protein TM1040_0772 [Ruegeria sp. TM1040]|uniref:hypothetical protein n=1 Tax=Ruegeria sp. (strain TM1040) TaxID=292414 RepID=UPI0000554C9C|nr:hypothetical protein [Ruegeria sp. TM1040]ABF63505.1 hypothetical protein TM1040_0772 [Ruegeria sp. TM1040]
MKRISLVALMCTLSACMQHEPLDTSPESVRFSSRIAQQNVCEYAIVEIRTLTQSDGTTVEAKGVPCTINGIGYSAGTVRPARVSLPNYLGKTEDASVTCRLNGADVNQQISAINATVEKINSTQSSGGGLAVALAFASVKGVIKSSRDATNDKFRYPGRIEVNLQPVKK